MNNESKGKTIDFHGAAIVDDNGKEVPITEEMIQNAIKTLEEQDSLTAQAQLNQTSS